MALLTIKKASLSGVDPAYEACAGGGDEFVVGAKRYLHVKNGDASPHTVTVDSKENCDQGVDHNSVTTVPAGGERIIGPFEDTKRWGNPTTKRAAVTYDGVTSMTIAVIEL